MAENLEMFFKEIKRKIIEAVKNDFPEIRKKTGKEKPYAAAFVTDSDYVTLRLGVNTYEFLEKADAKYTEVGDDYTTKWNPDEWGYTDGDSQIARIGVELSNEMGSIINQIKSQTDNLSYDQFQNLIEESGFPGLFLETVTSAFQELIQANVFGFNHEEITYFITMTDDEKAEEIENNSARVLNSNKLYEEFLKREIF